MFGRKKKALRREKRANVKKFRSLEQLESRQLMAADILVDFNGMSSSEKSNLSEVVDFSPALENARSVSSFILQKRNHAGS